VGIGTTSPKVALDISGQIRLTNHSTEPLTCDSAHAGTITLNSEYLTCSCNGTKWISTSSGKDCIWLSLVNITDPFSDGSLVSKYKFDGDVVDLLSANNGTASNLSFATGKFDNAASFNGSSSYIQVSNIKTSLLNTNTFSIAFWFKSTEAGASINVASIQHGGSSSGGIEFESGKIELNAFAGTYKTVIDTVNTNDNQWHFVAFTRDSSTNDWVLYVDNRNVGTFNHTMTIDANIFTIGAASNLGGGHFEGLIDQFEIYNKVLSPAEVSTLYNQ
jgi:hypothetical protein